MLTVMLYLSVLNQVSLFFITHALLCCLATPFVYQHSSSSFFIPLFHTLQFLRPKTSDAVRDIQKTLTTTFLGDPRLTSDNTTCLTPTMLTPGDEPNILIATTTSNVILLFATPHGIPFQPLSVSPSVSDPISSKPHENIPSSITVGGIELPVFIVLCVFGPFALSLVVFTLWKYTVVNLRHRKPPRAQATMEEGREEAEMQSRDPMRQNAKGTATIYLPPKLPAETHSAREVKSESEMVNFSWPVLSTLYHKPV